MFDSGFVVGCYLVDNCKVGVGLPFAVNESVVEMACFHSVNPMITPIYLRVKIWLSMKQMNTTKGKYSLLLDLLKTG